MEPYSEGCSRAFDRLEGAAAAYDRAERAYVDSEDSEAGAAFAAWERAYSRLEEATQEVYERGEGESGELARGREADIRRYRRAVPVWWIEQPIE